MTREALTEESDNEFDDGGELDDADEDEGEEDDLCSGSGGVEVAEANGEEGDDGEVDALEVCPVFLFYAIIPNTCTVRNIRKGAMSV